MGRCGEAAGSPRGRTQPDDVNVKVPSRATKAGDETHANEVRKLTWVHAAGQNCARNAGVQDRASRAELDAGGQVGDLLVRQEDALQTTDVHG